MHAVREAPTSFNASCAASRGDLSRARATGHTRCRHQPRAATDGLRRGARGGRCLPLGGGSRRRPCAARSTAGTAHPHRHRATPGSRASQTMRSSSVLRAPNTAVNASVCVRIERRLERLCAAGQTLVDIGQCGCGVDVAPAAHKGVGESPEHRHPYPFDWMPSHASRRQSLPALASQFVHVR